jgi:hypothetical protein
MPKNSRKAVGRKEGIRVAVSIDRQCSGSPACYPNQPVKIPFFYVTRAGLSLNYVLKYVGEVALSGLPMFSAASLVRTRLSMLYRA